jgi:exosortase
MQANEPKMNAIKYKNILTNKKTAFFSLLILNFVLFFVAFSSNLSRLDQIWQTDEYSPGYLIPLVALLIGWHRLAEKRPLVETSFGGSFFIALGGLFLIASNLATFQQPAFYGFVLGLYGITLSFLGNHVSKTLLPSFIYLLFAIPLPTFFYVTLSQQLQLWSSTLGVLPLKLLGLSVFQDGNIIDLGTTKLQVVEACNGLRYLFPLMSFGFLIAYLYEGAFWKRVVLFLSAIPLTLVMNALRIAVIGLTVDRWGPQMAEGVLHDFEVGRSSSAASGFFLARCGFSTVSEPAAAFVMKFLALPTAPILRRKAK